MLRLGMDLKDDLVPPHCHGLGHFPLAQVAQGLIQPGLEHFQIWGIHNLPEKLVLVSHHDQSKKKLFPRPKLNFPISIGSHYSLSYHYSSYRRVPPWLPSRPPSDAGRYYEVSMLLSKCQDFHYTTTFWVQAYFGKPRLRGFFFLCRSSVYQSILIFFFLKKRT